MFVKYKTGEIAQSSDTPKISCKCEDRDEYECNACVHCNSARESHDQKIRGIILVH
jgi:hypothetical protein